jgi:hypothetical protein
VKESGVGRVDCSEQQLNKLNSSLLIQIESERMGKIAFHFSRNLVFKRFEKLDTFACLPFESGTSGLHTYIGVHTLYRANVKGHR